LLSANPSFIAQLKKADNEARTWFRYVWPVVTSKPGEQSGDGASVDSIELHSMQPFGVLQ
jgi:hypothetical protein